MSQPLMHDPGTVKILRFDGRPDLSAPEVRRDALDVLENGGVVLLSESGFELTAIERDLISRPEELLAGFEEPKVPNGRPTIVFDPARGKITRHFNTVRGKMVRANVRSEYRPRLEAMMGRFSTWVDETVTTLFPTYGKVLVPDRITYRAVPARRAAGAPCRLELRLSDSRSRMFRLFCNIDPAHRPAGLAGRRAIRGVCRTLPAVGPAAALALDGIPAGPPRHRARIEDRVRSDDCRHTPAGEARRGIPENSASGDRRVPFRLVLVRDHRSRAPRGNVRATQSRPDRSFCPPRG